MSIMEMTIMEMKATSNNSMLGQVGLLIAKPKRKTEIPKKIVTKNPMKREITSKLCWITTMQELHLKERSSL